MKHKETEQQARDIVHNSIKRRVSDGSVIEKPWELVDSIAVALQEQFNEGVKAAANVAERAMPGHYVTELVVTAIGSLIEERQ